MTRLMKSMPVIAGAVAGAIVALLIASGGTTKTVTDTIVSPTSAAVPASTSKTTGGLTVNQIYKKDSPGVVDITTTSVQQGSSNGFFSQPSQTTEDEGAGVVYDKQGDILTDEHVVAGATTVTVHFQDGVTAARHGRSGTDPSTDVAVIKVNVHAVRAAPDPVRELQRGTGRRSGRRDRQPVRSARDDHGRHRQRRRAAASRRPTTTRSRARSRPTRRSTLATRAARCSTPTATCSASTTRSRPTPVTSAGRRLRDPVEHRRAGREHDHRRQDGRAPLRGRLPERLDRGGAEIAQRNGTCATGPVVRRLACRQGGPPAGRHDHQDQRQARSPTATASSRRSARYKPGDTITLTVREPDRKIESVKVTLGNRPATAPTAG